MQDDRLIEMSVELAKAHLASTPVPTSEVPALVRSLFQSLKALRDLGQSSVNSGLQGAENTTGFKPAVESGSEPPVINKDVSGEDFAGLDPWLAARVPRRVARTLNRHSEIHPSVHDDYLICLEDGETVKLLRSYLLKKHGMSVAEYMDRWGLPDHFPTAPRTYLEGKRALAKATGLGVTLRGSRGPSKGKITSKPRRGAASNKSS